MYIIRLHLRLRPQNRDISKQNKYKYCTVSSLHTHFEFQCRLYLRDEKVYRSPVYRIYRTHDYV